MTISRHNVFQTTFELLKNEVILIKLVSDVQIAYTLGEVQLETESR